MSRAGEFELINAFLAQLPHSAAPLGPGDDAAVLPRSRSRVCITTDALVEGTHFSRPAFSLADVGHKALAVNLSDLAAMGARPTWWLCALGLPQRFSRAQVVALAKGMRPLAQRYRLDLIGGNVTASPALTLTLTLAGEAKRPMLRSTARPGDWLYVSGALGSAAAGLAMLIGSQKKRADFVAAQKRPTPQVELGLAVARWASAAIDVSDGLLADLGHLCNASGVGAHVESLRLPLHPLASRLQPERLLNWALRGGEDYQLLLTVSPREASRLERAARRTGVRLTRIGTIHRQRSLVLDGKRVRPEGFDHFAAQSTHAQSSGLSSVANATTLLAKPRGSSRNGL
jgi:thiamine-monophosphate kinase